MLTKKRTKVICMNIFVTVLSLIPCAMGFYKLVISKKSAPWHLWIAFIVLSVCTLYLTKRVFYIKLPPRT